MVQENSVPAKLVNVKGDEDMFVSDVTMLGTGMSIKYTNSGIFIENSSKETQLFTITNGNKTITSNVGAGLAVKLVGLDTDSKTVGTSGSENESCQTIDVFDFTQVEEVKPTLVKKVSWLRHAIGSLLK